MLEDYVKKFADLRTYKDRSVWSALTAHQAPHKPFLLLAVMDLIAQGQITENFIQPSFELTDTFNQYWARVMPPDKRGNMAYPYPRLKTEGFWHLVPNPGYENKIDSDFYSMRRLRDVCAGARMDDELFHFMLDPAAREKLRATVIRTYFALEIRPALADQGAVNLAAYEYAKALIGQVRDPVKLGKPVADPAKDHRVRDQGFRRLIVVLYDHRCALCGIRLLTPEGHTIVEAAHIRPWSESQDDTPPNGLALCRLCHWSFDEGLMSVGQNYEVLVSRRVRVDRNNPGHVLTLIDRPIFKPVEQICWPAQDNIAWHREHAFK